MVDLSDVAEIGRDGIDVSHSALEAEKDTGFRLVAAPGGDASQLGRRRHDRVVRVFGPVMKAVQH